MILKHVRRSVVIIGTIPNFLRVLRLFGLGYFDPCTCIFNGYYHSKVFNIHLFYGTSLYDKRDDFNFHITNFPFLSSNIPSSPAYGVFISQLIRYARACSSYECFILRAARLSSKLLRQGYVMERLKSSLRKFYGRYGDLIKHYEVSLSQMLHDILGHDHIQWHPHWSDITPICEFITELDFNTDFDLITEFWRFPYNIATGAASQQRTLTPPDTWSCPIWDLHLF